jgi:hypothetical protein
MTVPRLSLDTNVPPVSVRITAWDLAMSIVTGSSDGNHGPFGLRFRAVLSGTQAAAVV